MEEEKEENPVAAVSASMPAESVSESNDDVGEASANAVGEPGAVPSAASSSGEHPPHDIAASQSEPRVENEIIDISSAQTVEVPAGSATVDEGKAESAETKPAEEEAGMADFAEEKPAEEVVKEENSEARAAEISIANAPLEDAKDETAGASKPPGPSGLYEGENRFEGRKLWNKKEIRSAARVTLSWRCSVARHRAYLNAQQVIEKIFDPRTNDYFYYNKVTTESRWTKARCLGSNDIDDLAATYTSEQAALMIQSALRRKVAKKRVRKMYAMIVSKVYDEYTDAYYYYNADTGEAFWDKPLILGSQDLEDILHDSEGEESDDGKGQGDGASGSDEEAETEDEESENDDDYASSGGSVEGKAPRDYPRSKMQTLVDEAEDVPEGPQRLNISGLGTSRISARIYDMVSLQELDVSHNCIPRMSEDIGNLANLTSLDVGHNRLKEVPVELEEMAATLKTLVLCNNQLTTYPANLYMCNKIETFDLSHNRITEIPLKIGDLDLLKICREWEVGMGQLTALTSLNIGFNSISEFPKQMERCPALTELNISHNNISAIPKTIEANKLLKFIDISSNPFGTIPPEFIQFKYLERLDASQCGLKELPSNLRHWSNLHELILNDNEITGLENSIVDLRALAKLFVNRNNLKRISKQISKLTKLREVHMNNNELTVIPEALCSVTQLQHLYINDNRLKTQPTRLRKLVRLQHLEMARNQLETLDPTEFGSLLSIREMDLSENRLSSIPGTMQKMSKCHTINLSHNRLAEIPRELGDMGNLRTLDMRHNNLTHLPESVSGMTSLEELLLQDNQITHLPEGLRQLGEKLRHIRIERNAFEKPPDLLPYLPKLQCVGLCQNKLEVFHEVNKPRKKLLRHQAKGLEYLEPDDKDAYDKASKQFVQAEEEYAQQFQSDAGVVGDRRSDGNVDYRNHFNVAVTDIHRLRHQKNAMGEMRRKKAETLLHLENVKEMEVTPSNMDAITERIDTLTETLLQMDDDMEEHLNASYMTCDISIKKFAVAESLCTQARMLGPGLEVIYNRAIAYGSSKRPHAAIDDLNHLLRKHKKYEPAMILRGEARESLGQYSQAQRDVLKSSASKGLNESDKALLEHLTVQVREGIKHIKMAGIDEPAVQRIFDVDSNGIMRRRRQILALDGQSAKQDFITAHAAAKEKKKLEEEKDAELMKLDREVATNKSKRYKAIVTKSRASRMAFRKKEQEEIAKRKEEERKAAELLERQAQAERERLENEDMAFIEWEQRDFESKLAKKIAAEEAARLEEEADAAELEAVLRGKRA